MHIPDGYLSPSTCASLYAASTPFWYVAFRRVKQTLSERTIPLVAVLAAFSFVIMLFNLPLPGGTTGHAVGMGIAAIVLGPWISILAISVALLVQALLFGDGGITAYGANCFNMAIIGSLVSIAVYRLIAYSAPITATRRALAAGIAGYAAINCAALCAAVEFGLQPFLFHDTSGTPLYAPYPLAVSIPAMMIGHLTFAGVAEFVLSAGMVGYLQRTDPDLLRATAPDAPAHEAVFDVQHGRSVLAISRKLWLVLAALLVLTPLGIIAAGSAWGEWRTVDYHDADTRARIIRASHDHALPERVPAGLEKWSTFWQAPLSDYAPSFIRSRNFGYLVSAAAGVGAIILIVLAAGTTSAWLLRRRSPGGLRIGFIEKTLDRFTRAASEALFAEDLAGAGGLLQRFDTRVKMAGLGALAGAAIAVDSLRALGILFAASALLCVLSRIPLRTTALRVWAPVLAFTGAIVAPAMFLTPGRVLFTASHFPFTITLQGVRSAGFLVMRAECAATLSFLLIATSYWSHILRSLRWFHIPAAAVALIEISYRYSFILLQTARNTLESRQTRIIGHLERSEQRRFASAAAATLLDKAFQFSGDVHMAMQARGYRGEVVLLEDRRLTAASWMQVTCFLLAAFAIVWLGR